MCTVIISLDPCLLEEWEGVAPAHALVTEIELARHELEIQRLFNGGACAEILLPHNSKLNMLVDKYRGTFIFSPKFTDHAI